MTNFSMVFPRKIILSPKNFLNDGFDPGQDRDSFTD